MAGENQQLVQDRHRLQLAAHVAEEELQRLRREVEMLRGRTASQSDFGHNPFAPPVQGPPTCPTDVVSEARSFASASAIPMETMFCPVCGCQNVVGRPSCWKCQTLFAPTVANNGADLTHVKDVSGCFGQAHAASVVPPGVVASQVPLPSASIAAGIPGSASIAARPASLVSGGIAVLQVLDHCRSIQQQLQFLLIQMVPEFRVDTLSGMHVLVGMVLFQAIPTGEVCR